MYGRILLACLVLLPLGCVRPTGPVAAGAGEERELVRQIAGHRHWTKPVTEAQVQGWVREIAELKRDALVEITPDGRFGSLSGEDALTSRAHWRAVSHGKMVVIETSRWYTQPSRVEILNEILSEVKAADFRPEPPKQPDLPFGKLEDQ